MLSGLDEGKVVWSGLPAWAESPGAHLKTTPPPGCCTVWEQSMWSPRVSTATDSRDCEGPLAFFGCSSSPADLISWDWPDLGQRLRAVGPGWCSYFLSDQSSGGFDHHLCMLLKPHLFSFLLLFVVSHLSCGIFWYFDMSSNVIYGLQFFCRLICSLVVRRTALSYFVDIGPLWISFHLLCVSFLVCFSFWYLGLCIYFYVSIIQLWFL